MTVVRKPIVQPMDATAYASPNMNMLRTVLVRSVARFGVMMRGFQPAIIAMPMARRPRPITSEAYLAFCSMASVNSREMTPTTMKRETNPADTAVPTRSALATATVRVLSTAVSSPR